jgi:hypothetical protein
MLDVETRSQGRNDRRRTAGGGWLKVREMAEMQALLVEKGKAQ